MLGVGERHTAQVRPRGTPGRAEHGSRPGEVARPARPRWSATGSRCERTYRRSLVDLAALRFSPPIAGGRSLPAAGLPWFMTMFGRDSILTSLQALPFVPELAAHDTARAGAAGRAPGSTTSATRTRAGSCTRCATARLTAFEERPHSPYYGNADATPLFVVLLDEYERWTGDTKLVRELEHEARAALHWIDEYADLQGNGYVSYQRPQRADRPGEPVLEGLLGLDLLPRRPAARVPARHLRTAGVRLRREDARRPAGPAGLEGPGLRRPAGARGGRPQARASTATSGSPTASTSRSRSTPTAARSTRSPPTSGTCCGAASSTTAKAKAVVRHLMGPRLFSGWGVRTLAEGEGRYNPIGYHVGTVWPFDNSFIAWGLRRYGFKEEAARIAAGILDAAEFFEGRLPEAFGGLRRATLTKYPVQYPTACSPQAWSTGAPLLLLRTMLGLEPVGDNLSMDPALPAGSGNSSCWTSRAGGAAWTPSGAAGSAKMRKRGFAPSSATVPIGPRLAASHTTTTFVQDRLELFRLPVPLALHPTSLSPPHVI